MSSSYRLPTGGRIDRGKPIVMRFNGREISAFEGDTAASALLANGHHFVGRSFKYHRPRGILSHGSDEANALLDVDRGGNRRDPNNRATVVEAFDGLSLRSQNHWPALGFDIGAVNDALGSLFAAGFYYKTFMWPQAFWKALYEPLIRRAAGLGIAPTTPDPDRYEHRHEHCETLVVGAGPAGLAAALAASEDRDARVILCDEQNELGGSLLHDITSIVDGRPARQYLEWAIEQLQVRANVRILTRTTAFGYFNHNHIALSQRLTDHLRQPPSDSPRERLWQLRVGKVICATGAHERPLVFAGNDRPGILLAESLRVFANRYAVKPGQTAVIATSGASAYRSAIDLRAAGLDVTIADLRHETDCGPELAAALHAGVEVLNGHAVVCSRGRSRVSGIVVAAIDAAGNAGSRRVLACDCVGMSGGWTPAVHLFSQSRGKMRFDVALDAFVPETSVQREVSAGAARGIYDLSACFADGYAAGGALNKAVQASPSFVGFKPARVLEGGGTTTGEKAFIDFQNDVTSKDIKLAVREGFTSIEHVKRYTTTGMATDQGKTSNMNTLGLVADQLQMPLPAVGTTTFRLPYTPVSFGTFAGVNRGRLFDPARETAINDWAAARGAVFEDVGMWKRAWYFPRSGEDMRAAVSRETKAVRSGVGIFDASTLGKIDVIGPDAAEFMDRIYTNAWSKLEAGRCRYGLMLNEAGYIMDDGVVARLGPNRFHVTTTTGGAARVLTHMEDYLQTEWPDLQVFLTSITEQWAVIAVQGRYARDIIVPLVEDIVLDEQSFPHMAVRSGLIAGVRCRLFRVSFTGELGYEINVPADFGESVWQALYESGRRFDITPYGTEAMHVLRAEKGYIIVGQETDGTVTPDDVGLGGLIGRAKRDFVGKRSLALPAIKAQGRKQLVGLRTDDPKLVLEEGAQLVGDPGRPVPVVMLGHVTSSYFSAHLGHSIALAVVADGRSRLGSLLYATTPEGFTSVRIVEPVFLDAEGVRLHA